jgi:hypothetical protein
VTLYLSQRPSGQQSSATAHNLRSVFDYIAWELAGGDPTDRQTQFPVCDTQVDFENRRGTQLCRIPSAAQAAIERMQPYHAQAPRRDITAHFLQTLNLLDIVDKHKLLTFTVAQPTAGGFAVSPEDLDGHFWLIPDAVLADGADIAEFVLTGTFTPHVQIEIHPVFDVAFADSVGIGDRIFVLSALSQIMQQVDLAIAQFDAQFFQ